MVSLDSQWFILVASLLGGYAFVFGFLRRLNEWYYVSRLGKLQHYPLPPGDMGWPFLGNMPTFLKAFKSDPESFINNLVSRYTSIYFSSKDKFYFLHSMNLNSLQHNICTVQNR